ncbi:uncharacterized protein [Halyomorpha halys]|uniref:uncharacterized protein n=1 Tax=Halyomorpha halys TaxID=286706 RepID=UPI0006D4FEDF|nr:uncharacterized protein LOC106686444 isoform X1 [Halyomorpha halys]XP_014285264.1 uncharacterized protein LOC106686444 isoform X1 [Halyomorpha halys]XP_014285274.1 uncharacterized protein LOC106686444 isoform X1 [Halyomorpha halys]KAE8573755.1 Odorant-binding protein 37 [Halyomorpha halys]
MMKFDISVVLTVIGIITTLFGQIRCHEEYAKIKEVFGQCSHELISRHELSKRIENGPDNLNYKVKCWIRCVMDKFGMIKKGKIDWEGYKHFSKQDLTVEEDKDKVDEIALICKVQVQQEKDECQLAYSAAVCQIQNWKALDFKTKDAAVNELAFLL